MKNLHKKISAVLLAGMVVFGGFAASGVSSFAASASSKVSINPGQEQDIKRVKFYSKLYGNVLVMNSEKELKDYASRYSRRLFYNNGRNVRISNAAQISQHLQKAKYLGKKFVKVEFHGLYYLIELK